MKNSNDCSRILNRLVTRRKFLAGLGATTLVAACGPKTVSVYRMDPTATPVRNVQTSPRIPAGTFPSAADRTLVVLELGGGNDSLATIVPHADARYQQRRSKTAITDPIDLDGTVGLHPKLTTIADLYKAGNVAIVEGVGYPQPDLSHFASMRIWWDGTETPDTTGWLGRYLDGSAGYDELLAGITIGPGPTQAMLGQGSFVVNIADVRGLAPDLPWWIEDRDELLGAWAGFAPQDVPLAELTPVQRAIGSTVEAGKQLDAGLRPLRAAIEGGDGDAMGEEGEESLIAQLRLAAQLIASPGVRPRVLYVHGVGDFDTHEEQRGHHDELMRQLDRGVAEFFDILTKAGVAERAVLATTSEFGRRAEENGGGTDHGTAGSHFVIGSAVMGGGALRRPALAPSPRPGGQPHPHRRLSLALRDGPGRLAPGASPRDPRKAVRDAAHLRGLAHHLAPV